MQQRVMRMPVPVERNGGASPARSPESETESRKTTAENAEAHERKLRKCAFLEKEFNKTKYKT